MTRTHSALNTHTRRKSHTRRNLWLMAGVAVITVMFAPVLLRAQVAPNLGTAHRFGVLGDSGVTGSAGGGSVITGDVGSFPTATITNFPPSSVAGGFTLHAAANATVQQAQTDAKSAYDFLAAQTGTAIGNALGGTLTPGVYSLGAGDLAASTTLTLNGTGIFIFNVASSLTMNSSSVVNGTADPCNIYWRVGTSATLNGTQFRGTVLADASITLGGGSVTGRLLAGTGPTGAVTMTTAGSTVGGCSQAPAAPTVSKAFSPTSIANNGVSRLTITLGNTNSSAISLFAALVDTLPAGLVVAAVPTASTTCTGTVTATAGASTVTLSNGSTIQAGGCTIAVNVTAPTGVYVNTIAAGALQTNIGNNAAAATATLTATAATCPAITLEPVTIPNGLVGTAYSQQFTAAGGTVPYVYTVSIGTLPGGLSLTGAGLLSGTPTANGSFSFTVRATDNLGCFTERAYTMAITTGVPTMPEIFLMLLALVLGTLGYLHVRRTSSTVPVFERRD